MIKWVPREQALPPEGVRILVLMQHRNGSYKVTSTIYNPSEGYFDAENDDRFRYKVIGWTFINLLNQEDEYKPDIEVLVDV